MTSFVDANTSPSSAELLECTLRDGSYAIDFQFSAADTTRLARLLDELGFGLIEVGHGIGIGASDAVTPAAATDLAYAKAASSAVVSGAWGMFAIPGIATSDQIASLVDEGMDFIRIGIDPKGMADAHELVTRSHALGLRVFVNFMKSYAASPARLKEFVEITEDWGVEGAYLVDSAGGMLPHEFVHYAEAMLEARSSVKLGFHGHDNLGLSVSHSLKAISLGFDQVDCTLQGIGRSSGNASTERLVAALMRLRAVHFDLPSLLRMGEDIVRPRFPMAGYSGLDTYAGYCLFHSSYIPNLIEVARRRRVDPYLLMAEHCRSDLFDASIEQLDIAAERILDYSGPSEVIVPRDIYIGGDQ